MARKSGSKAKGAAPAAPKAASPKPNAKGETIVSRTQRGGVTIETYRAGRGTLTFTRQVPSGKK